MIAINKCKRLLAISILGAILGAAPASALELGAFSDVRFTDSNATGDANAFAIGALDFYARQEIAKDTTVFIEYVFEGDDGFVLDLERLWIKRKFNSAFSLSGGRHHSPLGYWNRTYHHGVMIQDTVSRPFFLDFEDGDAGVLPVHTIGVIMDGDINQNVSYEASIANSSFVDSTVVGSGDKVELGIGNASDKSNGKSVGGRLSFTPSGQPMTISVFGMMNSVVEGATTGAAAFDAMAEGDELVDQTITGLDLVYKRGDFDLLAEFYNIDNDTNVSSGSDESATAFFTQFGYRASDKSKLVYRYESLAFEATDTYFQLLETQEAVHHVVAYRYDLDDTNALTLEVNRTDLEDSTLEDYTTVTLDWSFLLF